MWPDGVAMELMYPIKGSMASCLQFNHCGDHFGIERSITLYERCNRMDGIEGSTSEWLYYVIDTKVMEGKCKTQFSDKISTDDEEHWVTMMTVTGSISGVIKIGTLDIACYRLYKCLKHSITLLSLSEGQTTVTTLVVSCNNTWSDSNVGGDFVSLYLF